MLEFINHKSLEQKYPTATKRYNQHWSENLNNRKISNEAIVIGKFNYNVEDLRKFFDSIGLYIQIIPEFYLEGINWNYCIRWYRDKEKINEAIKKEGIDQIRPFDFIDGTMLYGDNNEYKTREMALEYAIQRCFYLLENKLIVGNYQNEFDKNPWKYLQNEDEYKGLLSKLPSSPNEPSIEEKEI